MTIIILSKFTMNDMQKGAFTISKNHKVDQNLFGNSIIAMGVPLRSILLSCPFIIDLILRIQA